MSKKRKPASTKGKPGNKNSNIEKRAKFAAAQEAKEQEEAKNSHSKQPEHLPAITPHPLHEAANKLSRGLYSDEILPKVEQLAKSGLNNNQIAAALCIGTRTFYEWRDKYPQFAHSLKKYRGVADIMVENALFQSAIGQNFTEVKKERRFNKESKQYEIVITEELTKHIPGNATAQIFYLKNRMPERYKDRVETVHDIGGRLEQMFFSLKKRED